MRRFFQWRTFLSCPTNCRSSLALPTLGSEPLPFGSFFIYSPYGSSDTSRKSRRIRDAVKAARAPFLPKAAERVAQAAEAGEPLAGFFEGGAVLVPAPRSAPLVKNALWPGDRIARALLDAGLGAGVEQLLTRTKSVPKAAFAGPGERPTIERHRTTLEVGAVLGEPPVIIVVDDVITKGTMLYACGEVLRQAYPDAEIRGFALLRTMGLVPEVERIIDPCIGAIQMSRWGDPNRSP